MSRMQCVVHPTETEPIRLTDCCVHHVQPCGGDPVDICEFTLRGATFQATPPEIAPATGCKLHPAVVMHDKYDVLSLNDIHLLGVGPEYVRRIELRIRGAHIAEGVLDPETGKVSFFSTRMDYPICVVPDHRLELWTWHTHPDEVPSYAIGGCTVQSPEDYAKLMTTKLNLLFVYAGCDDMNILSIREGMVELRYQRGVVDETPIVRCLLSAKPEGDESREYTQEEMEAWLNANYLFTPPLPIAYPMIEQ